MDEFENEEIDAVVEPSTVRSAERVETDFGLFLRALSSAISRVPAWVLAWLMLSVLTLTVALPWQSWFAGETAHRYEPGSLLHSLDGNFRFDHSVEMGVLNSTTGQVGAALALIAMLLGIFLAGGWLQIITERTEGHSVRCYCKGGGRYFFRFLRFWVLALLVLAAVNWALYSWPWDRFVLGQLLEVPKSDYKALETLGSELDARMVWWVRDGLAALCFVGVVIWGTYARTRMALRNSTAAFWSGVCAFFFILRHPIKTIRPLLFLFIVEFLVVTLIAGALTRWIDGTLVDKPEALTVLLLFAVAQVALMWREITRGAHYFAAVQVCREFLTIEPTEDASRTIGGPGGPQYPVDDDSDEYEVAL